MGFPTPETARCGKVVPVALIKIYCSENDKKTITQNARVEGRSVSQYLRDRGLSDLPERATLVELTSCMIQLIEASCTSESVKEKLNAIAQGVLEGSSIADARAQIAEVCNHADQGS